MFSAVDALLTLTGLLLVGGCGTPPWQEGRSTPTPTTTACRPNRESHPVRNDLAKDP